MNISRFLRHQDSGKLRFKTEHEQRLWGECARLITNCIIYYNAMLLSNLPDYYTKAASDDHEAALLKQVSPVAWQHINLYGRYEFSKSPEIIDIEAILKDWSQVPMKPTLPA